MPKPRSEMLTPREAQIMELLWSAGEATAEQVRQAMSHEPHDSTVRTLLRVLESKGYVTHDLQGKAYVYRPAIARGKAQGHALSNLLARLFGGSAQDLVLRLIEDERITPEQFDELRRSVPTPKPKRRRAKRRRKG